MNAPDSFCSTPGDGEKLLISLHEKAAQLCSICQTFSRYEFMETDIGVTDPRVYHTSLSSLRQSVAAGCPMCAALDGSLSAFLSSASPVDDLKKSLSIVCVLSYVSEFESEVTIWELDFWLQDKDVTQSHPWSFKLKFYPAELLSFSPEFPDPFSKATTARADVSLNIARAWYRQCLDHPECRRSRRSAGTRTLPSRLVQICSSNETPSELSLRVCETSQLPSTTPYVTLSHCWGRIPMFKLNASNFDRLKERIPAGELPKVFRDAVYITKQLGLDFIWIDSLCIIQDSKSDWKHEAKRMGAIYQHAECNIAASGYHDGSLGLFDSSAPLPHRNFPWLPHCAVVNRNTGRRTHLKGLYIRADPLEFSDTKTYSPLNRRAWVAQERALSPGIIHYTPEQMWWECSSHIACEAFPLTKMEWVGAKVMGAGSIRSLTKDSTREDIYRAWRIFVGCYAGGKLTREADRFPAVAGIARLFAELLDENFIAGLWEGDIVRSLLWRPLNEEVERIIPRTQVAPSWSWASLCVLHEDYHHDFMSFTIPLSGVCVKVLSDIPDFRSDLQSTHFERSNATGLAIRGPLRRLPSLATTNASLWNLASLWDNQGDFLDRVCLSHDIQDCKVVAESDVFIEQSWRWQDPTHILPLTFHHLGASVYGLILQQVRANESSNKFRRVGVIEFNLKSDDVGLRDRFLGVWVENEEFQPSVFSEESGYQDVVLV